LGLETAVVGWIDPEMSNDALNVPLRVCSGAVNPWMEIEPTAHDQPHY